MDIYSNIKKLCDDSNISTYRLCQELGFSTALMSQWKSGRQEPSRKKLQQIADFFNVTVEQLIVGEAQTKKSPASTLTEDEEMMEYLNELKNNPGMRILFSKAKGASKEDLEKVVKMIEIMRGDSIDGGYYF